ncbi:hypothetical protein H4R99_000005 [Coemansia sp. RSA 1722]|nr:hypothetical protein IWW45_000114 [Coemansia sp. RSA 485]KAJ2606832.1 hypothetical protein H4R99_000005 [Coemansia sp. RSA 1722]
MSEEAVFSADSALGYLQKKSRFYGWSKSLYLLDKRGLARLASEQQTQSATENSPDQYPQPTTFVIGSIGNISPNVAGVLKHKQLIKLSQILDISVKGQREIVLKLKNEALVLRAQTPGDCNLWLEALYSFSSSSAADASAEPAVDDDAQAPASSSHSSTVTDGESQCPPSTASTMGVTGATSFFIPSTEIPSLPLDISRPLNASSSISRLVLDTQAFAIGGDHIHEQDGAMGWLPSTCNLPQALESQTKASTSAQPHDTVDSAPGNETLCLQTYVPTASPEPKAGSSVAARPTLGSSGAKVDVESFDADKFFDEESNHARSSEDLLCSPPFSTNAPLCTAQTARDLTSGFIGSIAPTATSALDAGILNDYSGSCGFNDLFDILQDPRSKDSQPPVEDSSEKLVLSCSFVKPTIATTSPHTNHADAKPAPSTSMAIASKSNMGKDERSDQDNEESDVPLGLMFGRHGCSQGHALEQETRACSDSNGALTTAPSTLVPTATGINTPVGITDSMVILDTSIADFAGALINSPSLGKWDLGLGDTYANTDPNEPVSMATAAVTTASAIPSHTNTVTAESSTGVQSEQQQTTKLPVVPLNSPDHHRLGRRNVDLDRSVATVGGLNVQQLVNNNAAHLDDPAKPVGINSGMLAKYSSSLYASRALLATVGRGGRHASALNGSVSNGLGANDSRTAASSANAVPVVQYESVQPANTGVSKVIRGQIAKDIIGQETSSKSEVAVRRMRRIKSESKVVPLKAIRLKLNGSIVSTSESHYRSGVGSADGLCHGLNEGSHSDTTPLSKLVPQSKRLIASRADIGSSNQADNAAISSKNDPFGEYSEIQERLKRAEEQKRLDQRARMLDKEGVDNVRIADIIENRQDIPLAMQIEEKRRMQLAKQQALLSQQLEQQRIQMETQRANIELQRQHEQFKRQSLHPSLYDGSDGYAGQWMQYQDAYAGLSPPTNQIQQPMQSNRPVSSYGHYNPYMASYDQAMPAGFGMRPTTPATTRDPGAAFSGTHHPQHRLQQHQHRPGSVSASRPSSLYTNSLQMQDYQKSGMAGQAPARAHTISNRRQAGAAFVKHNRSNSIAVQSVHSNGSSDSWQSHVDHKSAAASIHAKTDPAYNGSIYIPSPEIATMTAKRSLSYGNADHFRNASTRPGFAGRGGRMVDPNSAIPPVPPLPHAAPGYHSHHPHPHHYSSMQGPPAYAHSGYSAWGSPPGMHSGGMGRHNSYSSAHNGGHPGAMYSRYAYGEPMSTDMHKFSRKRTEMSVNAPSLLQRLDQARETGLLPGRHVEKLPYSQGAYQNHNANQIIREGVNPQYFGDGDTLLIDRVYESEKTRSALMRKISRTYTGIGGETAPPAMFTH